MNPIFRQAIANIESRGSGGYGALGPFTKKGDRAYGRYQVMGDNLPSWTKEALGRQLSPDEFLADSQAQDKVFDHFFGKSVEKYGNPLDAASVWFTGRPVSAGKSSTDILGTTGNEYVNKFSSEMQGLQGAQQAQGKAQPMMMQPQRPRNFLEMLGLQKQQAGAQGETGQKFYQRPAFQDTMGQLASSLNSMRLNPDAGLDARMAKRQAANKQNQVNNQTAQYLAGKGREDLARAIAIGSMTGQEAMQALQQEKIATTAFDRSLQRDQQSQEASKDLATLQADLSLKGRQSMALLNDEIGDLNAEDALMRSVELKELEAELSYLAGQKLTAKQKADVEAALARIEIQQGQLEVAQGNLAVNEASEARLNTASEASNAKIAAETEALTIANDDLTNPQDDVASDVTFDSFDIKQAAAGDIGGVFKGLGNKVAGALGTGPVSPAQTAAVKQMDTINQVLRGPLAKELSSMGGKYALQLAEDILPKRGDNDFEMAEKIKNLVTQTLPAAEAAARAVLADKGSTKTERTRANGVLAKVPAITKALEASLAGSGYSEQTSQAQQDADAYLSGKLPAGVTPEDAAIAGATAPTQSSIGAADDLIDEE